MKQNKLSLISLVCIVLAVVVIFITNSCKNKNLPDIQKQEQRAEIVQTVPKENTETDILPKRDIDVGVNRPVQLSYKSKNDVLALRKKYVSNSIFSIPDYEPSVAVFGQIADGKPWYSTEICKDSKTNLPVITGLSEESRFINNPSMLVALEYPFLWSSVNNREFCNSSENQLIPVKISYSKSNNEIIVKYSKLPFDANPPFFYQFNGINASDLGYKYAYVDLKKSTLKFKFSYSSNNLSTDVQEFQNFIHLGGSCNYDGGCNNGSPRQFFTEFNYNENSGGGELYIKLWRSRPFNKDVSADINERIIIEN